MLGQKTIHNVNILFFPIILWFRVTTYLKLFSDATGSRLAVVGGVAVLDEAPESKPPKEPGGPRPFLLPLLLDRAEANMELGPKLVAPTLVCVRLAPNRRRSPESTAWFCR